MDAQSLRKNKGRVGMVIFSTFKIYQNGCFRPHFVSGGDGTRE
jgi:hypothetical protein